MRPFSKGYISTKRNTEKVFFSKAKLTDLLANAKSGVTLEKLGITAEKFEGQLVGGCFTYETPILTSDGQRAIGEIKIGDKVWSKNQLTGEVSLKPVSNVYVYQVNSLLNLWVKGQKLTVGQGILVHNQTTNTCGEAILISCLLKERY